VHLRPKKIEAAFNAIKTKKTKMLITKLHLESHYLHPLIYIIQIQPLVQQRTTFLFRNSKNNHYKKVWMTEKKSMLIFAYNAISKRKGMALISHLRRIKLAYRKRTQSIHALKFGLNGPIVVNGKKFNNAMSAMGLSNQEG
jgi:hypothetical protein